MKEKILKAIDKGLMNVLSTDITDQDIDFNTADIDNEYIPEISLEDLYEIFKDRNDDIFNIKYDTTNAVSLILDDGTEISLCEYTIGMHVIFVKISNDAMKSSGNEILIYANGYHYIKDTDRDSWQLKYFQMQDSKYLVPDKIAAENDYDGYHACERIMANKKTKTLPAIEYCRKINIGRYKGYLPAAGQLKIISDYIDMINYVLHRIGEEGIDMLYYKKQNSSSGYWWTSSEKSQSYAWMLRCGKLSDEDKKYMTGAYLPLFRKMK